MNHPGRQGASGPGGGHGRRGAPPLAARRVAAAAPVHTVQRGKRGLLCAARPRPPPAQHAPMVSESLKVPGGMCQCQWSRGDAQASSGDAVHGSLYVICMVISHTHHTRVHTPAYAPSGPLHACLRTHTGSHAPIHTYIHSYKKAAGATHTHSTPDTARDGGAARGDWDGGRDGGGARAGDCMRETRLW